MSRCHTVFRAAPAFTALFGCHVFWKRCLRDTKRVVFRWHSMVAIASPQSAISFHVRIIDRFIFNTRLLTFVTIVRGKPSASFGRQCTHNLYRFGLVHRGNSAKHRPHSCEVLCSYDAIASLFQRLNQFPGSWASYVFFNAVDWIRCPLPSSDKDERCFMANQFTGKLIYGSVPFDVFV